MENPADLCWTRWTFLGIEKAGNSYPSRISRKGLVMRPTCYWRLLLCRPASLSSDPRAAGLSGSRHSPTKKLYLWRGLNFLRILSFYSPPVSISFLRGGTIVIPTLLVQCAVGERTATVEREVSPTILVNTRPTDNHNIARSSLPECGDCCSCTH